MGQRDLHNHLNQKVALKTRAISTDTTTVGEIIDMQGFESLELLIQAGTLTDGDYTPLVEDGDDSGLSDAAAVSDDFLLGTEAVAKLEAGDDDKVSKIGYIGGKRFVRLSLVSDNTSTGGTLGATAVQGHARHGTEGIMKSGALSGAPQA